MSLSDFSHLSASEKLNYGIFERPIDNPYRLNAQPNKRSVSPTPLVRKSPQDEKLQGKLAKISDRVVALEEQVKNIDATVRSVYARAHIEIAISPVDELRLQMRIADLEYNTQKILHSLVKIKSPAPADHKAKKKLIKVAVEGLCETISSEGIKAIAGHGPSTAAKATQTLISAHHKSLDALRKKISG